VKLAFTSLGAGQENAAQIAAAIRALDIAARKGAIHQRNAARRKSRLLKRLGALRSEGKLVAAETVAPQPARSRKTEKAVAPVAEPKAEAKKAPAKAAAKKAPAKKTAKK
jgi:DNA-binding protein HU-beta